MELVLDQMGIPSHYPEVVALPVVQVLVPWDNLCHFLEASEFEVVEEVGVVVSPTWLVQ